MFNIDKTKLKEKLENYLGRKAKDNELINAEKDYNLVNEIILEKLEEIKSRLDKLEKQK